LSGIPARIYAFGHNQILPADAHAVDSKASLANFLIYFSPGPRYADFPLPNFLAAARKIPIPTAN
jgi:hypothetical protein